MAETAPRHKARTHAPMYTTPAPMSGETQAFPDESESRRVGKEFNLPFPMLTLRPAGVDPYGLHLLAGCRHRQSSLRYLVLARVQHSLNPSHAWRGGGGGGESGNATLSTEMLLMWPSSIPSWWTSPKPTT